MKTFLSIVMAMLLPVVAGLACAKDHDATRRSDPSQPPEIEARQTDMMPIANAAYRLYPNDIYPRDPGKPRPAEVEMSRAWSMANEFVYRTALRRLCRLPASAAGLEEEGYVVSFDRIGGGDELKVLVTRDFETVKWLKGNAAK